MIPLKKGAIPAILASNAKDWTDELVDTLARGQKPSNALKNRYNHPQIKDALKKETQGKCAYCESKVLDVSHGDIEHILPKSKVPTKAYDWDNLTLACTICNRGKGDYYSNDPADSQDDLVDPYKDNFLDHYLFYREVISPRPDSMRGIQTESFIKLARVELLESRRERMNFLDGLVTAHTLAEPKYKALMMSQIDKALKTSEEYCGASNAYIDFLKSKGVL